MFSPKQARILWDRWMRYECQYGTLQATQDLEKRVADVYPNGRILQLSYAESVLTRYVHLESTIKRFADRHKYRNVDTIAVRDLGFKLLLARTLVTQQVDISGSSPILASSSREFLSEHLTTSSCKHLSSTPTCEPPAKKCKISAPEPEDRRHSTDKEILDNGRGVKHVTVPSCPVVLTWFLSVLPMASMYGGTQYMMLPLH